MYGPLLLAGIVVAAFTHAAEQQGSVAPSRATILTAARGAELDHARVRSASIDGNRFDVTPLNLRHATSLERLRSVHLRARGNEAGAAEEVSLVPAPSDLHLMQVGGAWIAYAEFGETVYPTKGAITLLDASAAQPPTFRPRSACWWVWLFTGVRACSEAHAER